MAREDASIDLKTMHKRIGSGRLSFGKPDLLLETLGVTPGSVTPFALINDTDQKVTIILDQALADEPVINAHPLVNTQTTTILRDDLLTFIKACGHEPVILAVNSPM